MCVSLSRFSSVVVLLMSSVFFSLSAQAHSPSNHPVAVDPIAVSKNAAKNVRLPPPPEGVTDLSFNEFFKMPIGPRGLEPTEKLLSLNNKRVRVVGYMAKEDDPNPGLFMLAALPVNVGEKADGMADDLPAATLFVHMPPQDADKILTYRPDAWVLTGTLQVGNQEEISERVSVVRLVMDQSVAKDAQKKKGTNNKLISQQ
ncbi:MAG: hypothetical protein V4732_15990 [Pseudomonadota bacterium]